MNRIRIVIICSFILIFPFFFRMDSNAANYISGDEAYKFIYGKTQDELAQEAEQQYYEMIQELQRQEDEGKYIQNIKSKEDFLQALCYQTKYYSEEIYYDTNDIMLYHQLQDVIEEFWTYYCENDPLASGAYMRTYLVDGMTYTYSEKFDTEDYQYRIGITFKFKYPKEEFDQHMQDMSELASQLKCDNDYDSVKAVHDYLIEKADYDYDYKNYDDLMGMKDGVMVCQGYSMAAFNLLANMGIPVRMISGRSVGFDDTVGNHAWNIVCIDGLWYNMDVTWDDKGENGVDYQYFLKGSNDFRNHFPRDEYKKTAELVSATSYTLPNMPEDGVQSSNPDIYDRDVLKDFISIIVLLGRCGLLFAAALAVIIYRQIRK